MVGNGKISYITVYNICYRDIYDTHIKLFDGTTIYYDRKKLLSEEESKEWEKINVGDPAAIEKKYKNYIKGSDTTILKRKSFLKDYQFKDKIPEPPRVYDKFHINQFIQIEHDRYTKYTNEDMEVLNKRLMELNANLGNKKQLNTIIFIVPDIMDDFIYGVDEKWIGTNKNEVVIFIYIDKEMNTVRVQSLSWSFNNVDIETTLDNITFNEFKNISKKETALELLNKYESVLDEKLDKKYKFK